jgi:hypothetical protein
MWRPPRKRQQVVSLSTVAYLDRKLTCVEKRRSRAANTLEIGHILAQMRSPDELARAQAVRQVCPCHVPWDTYFAMRKAASRLRQDPSPLVRANAWHVEEDARELAALEALQEQLAERDERDRPKPRRKHGLILRGPTTARKTCINTSIRSREDPLAT